MSLFSKVFSRQEPLVSSNQEFWTWFQKHERQLFKVVKQGTHIEEKFFNPLSAQLNNLKDGYYFLVGMEDDSTAELIITADGDLKNIAFAEDLVKVAPIISGWRFTALKPAMKETGFQINIGEYTFSNENLYFYSNQHAQYPDEIDVSIVYQHYNKEDEQTIINGVHIFLDNLLGELNFVTLIDEINVEGTLANQPDLVPIHKLKAFLNWRQKEFTEKYEAFKYNADNDNYSSLEARLHNGRPLFAVVNSTLLNWNAKASHPWILSVDIEFNEVDSDGLPSRKVNEELDTVEEEIRNLLTASEGYLAIGTQTADGHRKFYWACKDFRQPARVMYQLQCRYKGMLNLNFDIYKDKYWQSFEQYRLSCS